MMLALSTFGSSQSGFNNSYIFSLLEFMKYAYMLYNQSIKHHCKAVTSASLQIETFKT